MSRPSNPNAEESTLDAILDEVAEAPVYRRLPSREGSARFCREGGESLPQPGQLLEGKYRIEKELGKGGMGVVFAATELDSGREVAVKWLRPERLERGAEARRHAAQRFVREARVAARVDHPQRVEVYDVGGDPEQPFLVMQRLHGETLRERLLRGGPMTWAEAVHLLLPVFDLLQAAHEAGVVHRDLKPDNLFLTREGSGPEVARVLDFGIASLLEREGDETTLTRTGSVLGTPSYMPLEQLRGERSLDVRADVYSLSVVLYEMLSGELPYRARNAADLAVALANLPPRPLSEVAAGLGIQAERVVMRGLAREPASRFASMEEFRAAVEAVGVSPRRNRRRGPAALGALTAAGLLALAWTFMATSGSKSSEQRPGEPVEPTRRVHETAKGSTPPPSVPPYRGWAEPATSTDSTAEVPDSSEASRDDAPPVDAQVANDVAPAELSAPSSGRGSAAVPASRRALSRPGPSRAQAAPSSVSDPAEPGEAQPSLQLWQFTGAPRAEGDRVPVQAPERDALHMDEF